MFKLHKPQHTGSIHSGHFMVSRLDEDEDDNNDAPDDSSESERDNANSVEIDVNNPESVVDATANLDNIYRVDSPSAKNEQLTSWNDLDRPANHTHKHHPQYLTYYTNSVQQQENGGEVVDGRASATVAAAAATTAGSQNLSNQSTVLAQHQHQLAVLQQQSMLSNLSNNGLNSGVINCSIYDINRDSSARGMNTNQTHLHQHHHIQDSQQIALNQQQQQQHQQLLLQQQQQQHSPQLYPHLQQQQHHQHHHHAVTIDTSLTKLLECFSLYYSSKLTSPKWKSFKGLKLRLKYKIRLNNLIWRAWFLQCIRGRRPPGCQFTAQVENEVHKKSETPLLEGKYWKRKQTAIADEYNKWRTFAKQKSCEKQVTTLHFRPSSFDWDTRVSRGPIYLSEYRSYPDEEMNNYHLDDLEQPILEDIGVREPDTYYLPPGPQPPPTTPSLQVHPISLQQQQQQPQQPQLRRMIENQQQNHLQIHQQQEQQQQQLSQLQQLSSTDQANSDQAISLKREQSIIHSQTPPTPLQPPQTTTAASIQQPQQHAQAQRQPTISYSSDTNPLYQHLQLYQQQQQQQQPQQQQPVSNPALQLQQQQLLSNQHHQQHHHHNQQQQHQIHQQPMQNNVPMSLNSQDLYQLGGGGGGGGGGGHRSEQRRVCHINAEQKRRCNIKNGFDTLKSILPSINQNINVKISKASMLQKAADYINALSAEQKQQLDEKALLKQQIEGLKQTINNYQSQLPVAGGPVGSQGSSQARELLQEYIRGRTQSNWKFWIFSLLIEPLFVSYYDIVSTNNLEEACKTILTWLDRSCGLVSLRKDVLESMTFLSTSTNILSSPNRLAGEALDAVNYHQPSVASNNHPSPINNGTDHQTAVGLAIGAIPLITTGPVTQATAARHHQQLSSPPQQATTPNHMQAATTAIGANW